KKIIKYKKYSIKNSNKVMSDERKVKEVRIKADKKKGEEIVFKGDYCLVTVGRRPYTDGLNAEAAGVKLNDRGQVEVNEQLQTNVSNIYAIGDVVKGAMLAHKASEEGTLVRS